MFNSPDPFIWVRDEMLPPNLCEDIINRFENDNRVTKGIVGSDRSYQPDIKRSDDLNISGFPEEWNDVDSFLSSVLGFSIKEYRADIEQAHSLKKFEDNYSFDDEKPLFPFLPLQVDNCVTDSGFQVQRTYPHDRYDWHPDDIIEYAAAKQRVLTYIFYLNDITEGGETEFMNGIKVQPRQGRMVLFPSTWTYLHRGRPPLGRTTKYIATGWVYVSIDRPEPPPQLEESSTEILEEEEDYGFEAPLSKQELTLDLTTLQ